MRTPLCMRVLVLVILLALAVAVLAQGVYRNQRIFVVPRPGAVAVDGALTDWDLSGEILTFVSEATSEIQSARTAMMYDAEALYISCRIADPSPMMNKNDPAVNPDFGWDADAYQLRLCLDPALGYPLKIGGYDRTPNENLVHMTLWYYTDKQQPVLHLKYGMNYHDAPEYPKGIVPAEKFQGAYKVWPDGKGFTLEYRIPWATLRANNPPKANDLTAGAIQIQWSDPEGRHSVGSGWAVDLLRQAGFSYQSTGCWGKAIFTDHGNLPKELTQEGLPPVRDLPLKFQYTLPKESVVSVALINEKGDRVRHIIAGQTRPGGALTEAWDGLDDTGHVLPPGKYTWKAAYHEPFSVKYVMSVGNSGTPGHPTPNGKGAWGGDWAPPQDVCFAGEKALLAWDGAEAGPGIIMLDGKEQKQWGSRFGARYLATDGEWLFAYLAAEKQLRAYAVATGKETNYLRGEMWAEPNAGKEMHCTGLAYLRGKLYVADAAANTVTEYDARKGTILRTLTVEEATWLAPLEQDTLLAISKGRVMKVAVSPVAVDGKSIITLIADHLDTPQAVTAGPDGTIYVSNLGALQNISVFDKNGKYLRSIGKPGGRALPAGVLSTTSKEHLSPGRRGAWDRHTLLNPRGMAVDPQGRLWVVENDFQPKRISVWDVKTGACVTEKFGPCYVSTPATMDPADPTRVYTQNIEWKVDLDKGTWSPSAVMIDARQDAPYFWPHMVMNIVFTAKNGKQYMHAKYSEGQYLYVRRGDHFEGVAGVISPWANLSWRPGGKTWQDVAKIPTLLWEDLNGDGIIQQAETRPTKMRPGQPHSVFTADLTMYAAGMYNDLYWQRLSPKTIKPNGVPLYDDATFTQVEYAKGAPLYTYDLTINPADGSVLMYAGADIKHLDKLPVWPLTRWTKEGTLEWRYYKGCRWHDMYEFPIPKTGELYGCTKNLGITDGITGYSCYFGKAQLLTTDGIMLGTIMQDGRAGETSGADRIYCEWFSGQLVKIKDGRWFLLGGDQDGRVLQVFGLDTIKRFEGALTISEGDAKAAAAALAQWTAQQAKGQSLVLARTQGAPDWMNIRGIIVTQDEQRQFTTKAAYDDKNLYLQYTVMSPNQLVNSFNETSYLFKGGNCLDLQLAADPAADAKRVTPAPGDIRVLITRREGKPVAVIYRYKVKDFQGDPTVYTSPTGKEAVDQLEVWTDVALTYEKTDTGFIAVATLPLAKLGWKPVPGTTQKMDVGYLFGNETGNSIVVRKYWSNHGFSAGVTNDVPNEVRIEPAQWGAATVE